MMLSGGRGFVDRQFGAVKITTAMASSPLRQLLEERVSRLLADADALAGESRGQARRECAERLNQAARRLRQAQSLADLAATLVDAAAAFATGAALFVVEGESARLENVRGVEAEELPARFEIPLASAPALAGAIETRDPVTAAAVPGEISPAVVDLLGHAPDMRVSLVPVVVDERVPAILYGWGNVEESALELLAQVAGAEWAKLAPAQLEPEAEPLVTIAPAAAPVPAKESTSWDALSPDEQQIHLSAQRFARVQVAEMRLFEAEAVQNGRSQHDLYGALHKSIDSARSGFREKFFARCPSMVDYLHLELLRTIAHDDAELLGPEYPGPLA
jgi:DNA gyrase/topoisomerase IV subunit B